MGRLSPKGRRRICLEQNVGLIYAPAKCKTSNPRLETATGSTARCRSICKMRSLTRSWILAPSKSPVLTSCSIRSLGLLPRPGSKPPQENPKSEWNNWSRRAIWKVRGSTTGSGSASCKSNDSAPWSRLQFEAWIARISPARRSGRRSAPDKYGGDLSAQSPHVANMPTAAAAMTAVASQPRLLSHGPSVN